MSLYSSLLFTSNLQNVLLFRSEMNSSFMKLARHCAVFTYAYYLANVILFNKPYFQIKITKIFIVCSIIPEAWNIHTVMLSLLCSNMNRSFMALPRHCAVAHCKPLFTYNILPSRLENGILFIKLYFQIKINNLQRVYIIQEAWNIQACQCLACTLAYTW